MIDENNIHFEFNPFRHINQVVDILCCFITNQKCVIFKSHLMWNIEISALINQLILDSLIIIFYFVKGVVHGGWSVLLGLVINGYKRML